MANDLKTAFESIKKAAERALEKDKLDPLMREIADMIRLRTKLGGGVSEAGGTRKPLKKLSPSYKAQRGNKVRFWTDKQGRVRSREIEDGGSRHPDLDDTTTPSKSNLTFTGQLLRSITGKAIAFGRGVITLEGGRRDSELTNEQVGKFVTNQGRPFLNLSDTEIKRIADQLKREILKSIKNR